MRLRHDEGSANDQQRSNKHKRILVGAFLLVYGYVALNRKIILAGLTENQFYGKLVS